MVIECFSVLDEGSGEVWKHQNLRVAYVAQHSFYHIEKHLDISPVDYIKQRFAGGVDKEGEVFHMDVSHIIMNSSNNFTYALTEFLSNGKGQF